MTVLNGTAASPGKASGPPLIIKDNGHGDIFPGAILVGRVIHPHHAPLFLHIGGVIAEDGGVLQHAAILAREFGIPAVIGVPDAVALLADAAVVSIDGDTGAVAAQSQ